MFGHDSDFQGFAPIYGPVGDKRYAGTADRATAAAMDFRRIGKLKGKVAVQMHSAVVSLFITVEHVFHIMSANGLGCESYQMIKVYYKKYLDGSRIHRLFSAPLLHWKLARI
jgi:hypothetical protein